MVVGFNNGKRTLMLLNNNEYLQVVADIKSRIYGARQRALSHAYSELSNLYWNIGTTINEHSGWGSKFIDNLSFDIKQEFPDATGYSVRNLKYMAKFARTYPNIEIVQRSVAQLPWRHNIALIEKLKDSSQREWYAEQTIENGWSRDILVVQIESDLYGRQALKGKTTNYESRLPDPQSDLAIQTLKDPYLFDFIERRAEMRERDIESQMVSNITKLLLELGAGFAFIGNQYHLEVEGEDFYIDLLFWHTKLRCFVVIELKAGEFKPEYAGKLNFYVSAVDDILKTDADNPTIGILLCRNKKGLIAEYALKDIEKPIGVSEYKLLDRLPEEYESLLPTAEDIMSRIGTDGTAGGEDALL
jgi:predicted nuclease of restriction endonuclease-like (RecB) superfamily